MAFRWCSRLPRTKTTVDVKCANVCPVKRSSEKHHTTLGGAKDCDVDSQTVQAPSEYCLHPVLAVQRYISRNWCPPTSALIDFRRSVFPFLSPGFGGCFRSHGLGCTGASGTALTMLSAGRTRDLLRLCICK